MHNNQLELYLPSKELFELFGSIPFWSVEAFPPSSTEKGLSV